MGELQDARVARLRRNLKAAGYNIHARQLRSSLRGQSLPVVIGVLDPLSIEWGTGRDVAAGVMVARVVATGELVATETRSVLREEQPGMAMEAHSIRIPAGMWVTLQGRARRQGKTAGGLVREAVAICLSNDSI